MIKFEKVPADILCRISDVKLILTEDGNIIFAYLFGGLTKGDVKPFSDIDLAVYLRDNEHLGEYKLQLFDRLTQALGTSELDLIILNSAPISLTGRILQTRQVLVDKEPFLRHNYESLILRDFFDFKVKEDILLSGRYGIGKQVIGS
jgi:predicted nucleotidyltransferase